MIHTSPSAQLQDLIFLMQSGNGDLQKKLSHSVAGENVRLETVKRPPAMGGRQVDGQIVTIVIGSDVKDPVRSAQHFHAMEKNAKIILLTKSRNIAKYINHTIRFSPYLNSNVSCLNESDKEKFESLLHKSLTTGRYRVIIEEANTQFSFSKTHKNSDSGIQQRRHALNNTIEKLLQENEELKKMNKELEAFTYVSSHDLQEPLRKIQLFAGRVRDNEYQNLSEKGVYYFEVMQDAAERMQILIEDLLTFSRVKNGGQKFKKIELEHLVEEVKFEHKEFIAEKNATIEVVDTCPVLVITFQFRQLMSNLISNSLKYSKPDSPPQVIIKGQCLTGDELLKEKPSKLKGKLISKKNYCYISIEDNGIGFDPGYAERIFEVFQRLHSREEYEGTGIGLAIVKKIVENHEGVITVDSEPGKGTTFSVIIPLEQE